jgi:hypothetical protein
MWRSDNEIPSARSHGRTDQCANARQHNAIGGNRRQPCRPGLDSGVNSLDTANVYGMGESESALGQALRRNGRRDRLVLASKFHAPMGNDPNAMGSSRRHIIEQIDLSLSRLGVDHLDIYYIHRPTTRVPIDETLRALDDLARAGKMLCRDQQLRRVASDGVAVGGQGAPSCACGSRADGVLVARPLRRSGTPTYGTVLRCWGHGLVAAGWRRADWEALGVVGAGDAVYR